ncbi:hypothetical protein NUACC21_43270 [Scytonema sp. NUACC21]
MTGDSQKYEEKLDDESYKIKTRFDFSRTNVLVQKGCSRSAEEEKYKGIWMKVTDLYCKLYSERAFVSLICGAAY